MSGWKQLTDDQRATIVNLEKKLAVTGAALRAFFRVLGEAEVPVEQLELRLVAIAKDFKRARDQVAAAPGDEPVVAKLKDEARAALDAGELERAAALLEKVLASQDAQRQLEAAGTLARRGEIALTRLRYREAAQHFAAAAKRVPPEHEEQALAYFDQEVEALYRQGNEFGDNAALASAIDRCRMLLKRRTRERMPLQWATTQNNLGNALSTLGERESSTQRLQEAVEAYAGALNVFMSAQASYYVSGVRDNLKRARVMLVERQGSSERDW